MYYISQCSHYFSCISLRNERLGFLYTNLEFPSTLPILGFPQHSLIGTSSIQYLLSRPRLSWRFRVIIMCRHCLLNRRPHSRIVRVKCRSCSSFTRDCVFANNVPDHGQCIKAHDSLDQRSEMSFARESLAQRLRLSHQRTTMPVIGEQRVSFTRNVIKLRVRVILSMNRHGIRVIAIDE